MTVVVPESIELLREELNRLRAPEVIETELDQLEQRESVGAQRARLNTELNASVKHELTTAKEAEDLAIALAEELEEAYEKAAFVYENLVECVERVIALRFHADQAASAARKAGRPVPRVKKFSVRIYESYELRKIFHRFLGTVRSDW